MSNGRTDGRRTDTRERIRATALALFVSQGFEATTLAQVADRLRITRPAVYHHFTSKEDVVTSAYEEVMPLLDAIVSGGHDEALERTIELFAGPYRLVLTCSLVNERALRGTPGAAAMLSRLDELATRLAPAPTVEGVMRGRLALSALTMAVVRAGQLGATEEVRMAAACTLARSLAAPAERP